MTFIIKDAFYVPESPHTLICPQQWASQRSEKDTCDNPHFVTKSSFSRLSWNNGKSTLTIPHDTKSNLPMWRTAPGFKHAAAFICKEVGQAYPSVLIEDDEDTVADEPPDSNDDTVQAMNGSRDAPFLFDVTPNAQPYSALVEDPLLPQDQQEFLDWHYKTGHTSFKFLKVLAEKGLIPRKLKNCREPVCPACLYGKQMQQPW